MYRHNRLSLLGAMSSIAFMAAEAAAGEGPAPIELVLQRLNTENDEHWTKGGEPLLEYLQHATSSDVSRADVDAITDGTKREAWADWADAKWPAGGGLDADADPDGAAAAEAEVDAEAAEQTGPLTKEGKIADDVARAEAQRVSGVHTETVPVPGQVVPFHPAEIGDSVIVTWPEGSTFDGASRAYGKVVGGDGSAPNIKVFAPNGGADATFTGVRHSSKRDEMAADSPDRNLPVFDYLPARSVE